MVACLGRIPVELVVEAFPFQKKVRIARNRGRAADRKNRTRRLILIGSYMEHITANDEAAKDRLMKGLDSFLDRGPRPGSVRPAPYYLQPPLTAHDASRECYVYGVAALTCSTASRSADCSPAAHDQLEAASRGHLGNGPLNPCASDLKFHARETAAAASRMNT